MGLPGGWFAAAPAAAIAAPAADPAARTSSCSRVKTLGNLTPNREAGQVNERTKERRIWGTKRQRPGGLGEAAPIICGPVSVPVLNSHLVGRGRLGAYSATCIGEAVHAWSCGNYRVLYWVGGRGLKEAGYVLVRHHRLRVRLLAKHGHHSVRLCGPGETIRISRPGRRHPSRNIPQPSPLEPS